MKSRTLGVMRPERYGQLLARAAREFAACGFELASLNSIIRDCATSKSSFYTYFGSKEALFDRVVGDASAALAADLNAARWCSRRQWAVRRRGAGTDDRNLHAAFPPKKREGRKAANSGISLPENFLRQPLAYEWCKRDAAVGIGDVKPFDSGQRSDGRITVRR